MTDRRFLEKLGVHDPRHQEILIDSLPCGISTAQLAWKDGTLWQTNAPRAILVCYWKGMVDAFRKLELRND